MESKIAANRTSHQEVVSVSLPFESGLGHETCFDQEDRRKHDVSKAWLALTHGASPLLPLGTLTPLGLASWKMRTTGEERPTLLLATIAAAELTHQGIAPARARRDSGRTTQRLLSALY